jgi:hypothetical protein
MEHLFQTDKITQCSVEGDPDWWFDYNEEGVSRFAEISAETKMAISICNRCDALEECRAWALQYSNLFGVWGGLVPANRTRLRKHKGIKQIDFAMTWDSPLSMGNKETV